MRFLLALIFFATFGMTAMAVEKDLSNQDLFKLEDYFATAVKKQGVKAAFLQYLDDSSLVFLPHPENGIAYYKASPDTQPLLQWKPVLAEMANSADFGYTIGPWNIVATDTTQAAKFGHYLSIWKKVEGGKWHVILDVGISHEQPDSLMVLLPERRSDKISKRNLPKRASSDAFRSMSIADNIFATIAGKSGIVEAYRVTAATDIRLFRNNQFPVTGIDAAQSFLSDYPGKRTWKMVGGESANSGELGYTYGEVIWGATESRPEHHGYYVRIWRLTSEESWKVAVDFTIRIPTDKK